MGGKGFSNDATDPSSGQQAKAVHRPERTEMGLMREKVGRRIVFDLENGNAAQF
jgi:hypothetical protein